MGFMGDEMELESIRYLAPFQNFPTKHWNGSNPFQSIQIDSTKHPLMIFCVVAYRKTFDHSLPFNSNVLLNAWTVFIIL